MDTPRSSLPVEEKQKSEIATLKKRILKLEAEIRRLQAKVINAWGDA